MSVRDPIAQVRDNLPPAEKTKIEGNLVWQALKRKGAAGWFAAEQAHAASLTQP